MIVGVKPTLPDEVSVKVAMKLIRAIVNRPGPIGRMTIVDFSAAIDRLLSEAIRKGEIPPCR